MMSALQRFRVSRPWPLAFLLAFSTPASADDFYLSLNGRDSNSGRSPSSAWRTIGRLHQQALQHGDTVNFEGGATYPNGPFWLESSGVTVQSYGTGRATIQSTGHGLGIYNSGNVTIRNLNLIGSRVLYSSGVQIYIDQPHARYANIVVEDVDVSNFGNGVEAWGNNGTAGVDGLRIARVAAHHNVNVGIVTHAATRGAHRGVLIQDSSAGWNVGTPEFPDSSGNGIVLGQVDGGIIERSVALENGSGCTGAACGAGIWAWDSNNVVIRQNESHHNRTDGPVDGDGFDLDWGVTNSVMEHNYSHDNEGAGFLLLQLQGVPSQSGNNIVRYNRSVNDGLRNGFGSLMVYGDVGRATFTGNTVDGMLDVNQQSPRNEMLTFTGNTYIGPFKAWWNDTMYHELATFRAATGQESSGPEPRFGSRSAGDVWAIDRSGLVLRNGVSPYGNGRAYDLRECNDEVYILGTDWNWYRWAGSSWSSVGPTNACAGSPPSSHDVWSLGEGGLVLHNGVSPHENWRASELRRCHGAVYILGMDGNWWLWAGNGYTLGTPTCL